MSFKDWFNYMLKRVVWYMETPKEERQKHAQKEKQTWVYRWFGLVPLSIKFSVDQARKRLK